MTELNKHVVSLELSRRLKELKVPQKSVFYWTDGMRYDGNYDLVYLHAPLVKEGGGVINTVSAYLASELGEMLPDIITGEHLYSYQQARNWSDKRLPKHRLVYWFAGEIELYRVDADTECDARAKMLIYLLENHLISVEELNLTK